MTTPPECSLTVNYYLCNTILFIFALMNSQKDTAFLHLFETLLTKNTDMKAKFTTSIIAADHFNLPRAVSDCCSLVEIVAA